MAGRSAADRPCQCGQRKGRRAAMCRACWNAAHPPVPVPVTTRWEIDEMAVERLRRGDPVASNPGERRAAAKALDRYGLTVAEIARRLRVSERTVVRYRRAA